MEAREQSRIEAPEPMPTPTLVVGRKDFDLIMSGIGQYVIHGRKGLKVVPPVAQEIGDNEVYFPGAPKEIVFRRRFTLRKVTRQVRYITANNEDRFDLRFYVNMKEIGL